MSISLIANSGIQIHRFNLNIQPNADLIRPVGYYEFFDPSSELVSLEYAYFLPDMDIWVRKLLLKEEGYIDENNKLVDDINYQIVKPWALNDDVDYYTVGDAVECLDIFNTTDDPVWLPIPYFRKKANGQSAFGPIGWARMMVKARPVIDRRQRGYDVVLAFDTQLDDDQEQPFAPRMADTAEDENTFALANNEDQLLSFFDETRQAGWVGKRILDVAIGDAERPMFPYLKHIARYIYLLKYLNATGAFPEITLLNDTQAPVDVDLVLDIGNANTCGLLFENTGDQGQFEFKSVKKLRLTDLSLPELEYDEPFSMRLAFAEARFGDIHIPQYKNFRWPSLVRLGKEAARLITQHKIEEDKGRESASHHSSPKRYLWDTRKASTPWEFINFRGANMAQSIYYEGISEQFKENGDFAYDGEFACLPVYSRKSLMTFVYIEIFLHAIAQINSYSFRKAHGNEMRLRRLRRVTITCPTAIIQKEQVVLRECAVEASRALNRFSKGNFIGEYNEDDQRGGGLEIIPKPRDLAKKLTELAFRRDWIYDEATCCQLVFLYAEIKQRYLNKADVFFDLYGRRRSDVSKPEEKSLTIASIDIGGGTTDVMISAYQYERGQNSAVLKPHPLFWESYNLAGDDLLKEIVQQIVIEGKADDHRQGGGVIENEARKAGVQDLAIKMNSFFGSDNSNQTFIHRTHRKNFTVQVAAPIAAQYLAHAASGAADNTISYDEMFGDTKPSSQLIDYFNQHFAPLRLENIQWPLSTARVNAVVEYTFDPLFRQLTTLVSTYGCDYLLLAGRPTTIPKIRDLFIKYYPVPPQRLVTLNNYRVGRWYPYASEIGYISDPKTIVCVGAVIALMGGSLDRLGGFRLNTELLRKKLIPTSDYIGLLDTYTYGLAETLVTPDENSYDLEVHTLPMTLGYKQIPSRSYRARPIYKVHFNEDYFREKVLEQNPDLEKDEGAIAMAIENYRTNLQNRMPFLVKLKRDWNSSREHLTIESVRDANRNESSRNIISLSYQTLPSERGYWLDTGEFVLNIR